MLTATGVTVSVRVTMRMPGPKAARGVDMIKGSIEREWRVVATGRAPMPGRLGGAVRLSARRFDAVAVGDGLRHALEARICYGEFGELVRRGFGRAPRQCG